MYCAKCGANMKQSQKYCPKCGAFNIKYAGESDAKATPKAQDVYTPKTPVQQKTPYHQGSFTDETLSFQPVTQEQPVSPAQDAQAIYPVQQPRHSYETEWNQPTELTEDTVTYGEFAYADNRQPAQEKPKKKKGLIAFIVIVIVLLVLAGGVLIFMQTDIFKIKKAEYLIGKGELKEAKSTVAEISSVEGETFEAYIAVLEKKQAFLSDFNASKETAGEGQTNLLVCTKKNNTLYTASNEYLEAFKTFENDNDVAHLPKTMQEDYTFSKKVIDSLYESGFSKEMFYKVQEIYLCKVQKNKQDEYTFKQVQEAIEVTDNAYKQIESAKNTLKNISSGVDDGEYISLSDSYYREISGFVEAMDILSLTAKAEADNEQRRITDDLKKNSDWTMETKIYLTDADKNYVYSFDRYFEPIADEKSMDENADLVMHSLQVGILGLYLNHPEKG